MSFTLCKHSIYLYIMPILANLRQNRFFQGVLRSTQSFNTILAFKMQKWFPNIFESPYLHITIDLVQLYISKK